MKALKYTIVFLIISCNSHYNKTKEIDFTSDWDTTRILSNPYKGWYHHLLDNGIERYPIEDDSLFASFPGMDHLYLRLAWSYLEPKEGEFNWTYIDDIAEKYVPKGYRIAFRITCSETGSFPDNFGELYNGVLYATPSWVAKAGAKGVVHQLYKGPSKTWIPKWDDPVFLAKLNNFHRAFADRYDGKTWVSYIDIGSIGDWGEGHTAHTTEIPPTLSEVMAHINIYLNSYKISQLVATDDLIWYGKSDTDRKKLFSFVTDKGISLRDDSPLVDWYVERFLDTWTVKHPEFYNPTYLETPIVFELQHYHIVKNDGMWLGKNGMEKIAEYDISGAEIMRKAIILMHATYIGYHGYAEEWLLDNPDLTNDLVNRCGYWYFPVSATVPGKLGIGENSLSIEWLNKGVAPAYHSFSLILHFEAVKPENSFKVIIDDSHNTNWLPGKRHQDNYEFVIPSDVSAGQYILTFKLIDRSEGKEREIQLGLNDSKTNDQGFIYLAEIAIQN